MKFDNFMRIILFFDLPMVTKEERRIYRRFSKNLTSEGYIRLQFSVYSKLCINSDAAVTATKNIARIAPVNGEIRYMVVTEKQYQSIKKINEKYSLQENITTSDRTIMIGGMNDEDSD